MKKIKQNCKNLLNLLFLINILLLPFFMFAELSLAGDDTTVTDGSFISASERLRNTADPTYNTSAGPDAIFTLIGSAINVFLSLLGAIFVVLMLYGGYNWMTAAGNDSKIETAQKTISRSIIGLIVTVGAWAIWKFVSVIL